MSEKAPLKLESVEGFPDCSNDVIYCPPLKNDSDNGPNTIVFFPGDVQTYPEIMEKDPESKAYLQWNLINMGLKLQAYYDTSHIIIIKPSRIEANICSCYDNFVESDLHGAPELDSCNQALPHLEALLCNTSARLKEDHEIEFKWEEGLLTVIGFSKGCVVLNQLLQELFTDSIEPDNLDSFVKSIIWLDSGHPGPSGIYITDPDILKKLAATKCELHVEVTPYQVVRRPQVEKEEEIFTQTLKENGANVTRNIHFSDSPPCLMNHFKLLEEYFSKKTEISSDQ